MTVIHDNLGNPIDGINPLPVKTTSSDAILPVDIQSRLASTIQTHNAVSVALSSFSTESTWHDTDGFVQLAVTLLNDNGSTNSQVVVNWSNDGISVHGAELLLSSGSSIYNNARSASTPVKARYFKITIQNADGTLAHTMSAWAYLTA